MICMYFWKLFPDTEFEDCALHNTTAGTSSAVPTTSVRILDNKR